MLNDFYAVIMAGGGGTRLWPLSRTQRPKQMLALGAADDGPSLFQLAVRRLEGLFPLERVLVVTTANQAAALQRQEPGIPPENYLLEPMPRGTASVVGLAAAALSQRQPGAVMAVLTADHFIANEDRFRQLLQAAYHTARSGRLVTLGVAPTFPASGYGYIQTGAALGVFEGQTALAAVKFKEKPSVEQAAQFIAGGDHAWNSGMFIWQVADVLAEFERQMPALYASLQEIAAAWNGPERPTVLQRIWPQVQVQTIDYGIMEGARQVAVLPAADLGWNDVGSWQSVYEILPKDGQGNAVRSAQALAIDAQNNLIFSQDGGRLVVALGVEDLVIVDTGDVILVSRRDAAQDVRKAVEAVRRDRPQFS